MQRLPFFSLKPLLIVLMVISLFTTMIALIPNATAQEPDGHEDEHEHEHEDEDAHRGGELFTFSDSFDSREQRPPNFPSGFVLDPIVTGLSAGIAFEWVSTDSNPDDFELIYIAQKNGVVRVADAQTGQLFSQNFLDISAHVNIVNDRGLLDIAVHPDFPSTPYLYLLYSYDPEELLGGEGEVDGPDGAGHRVSRLTYVEADINEGYLQPKDFLPNGMVSETVVLGKNSTFENIGDAAGTNVITDLNDLPPPSCDDNGTPINDCLPDDEDSHSIGTILFDDVGNLLLSKGDGASYRFADPRALRALDEHSLAGKILRIDPLTGNGVPGNPFYEEALADTNRARVYNSGLRNPFRFTLDPITSEPVIGDVGLSAWEEVNTGIGRNFGWPCYEGGNGANLIQPSYDNSPFLDCDPFYNSGQAWPAVYAYPHAQGRSSIIMGDFYIGDIYPSSYQDSLFVADFNAGTISTLTFDGDEVSDVEVFASETYGLVQMQMQPEDGFLYLMFIGFAPQGIPPIPSGIYRLQYVQSTNTPPIAQADATPSDGPTPLTVSFSSANTVDPNGDALTFEWDFADGNSSNAANPTHTFNTAGVYTVVLTATDPDGAFDTDTVFVTAGNSRPSATILTPAAGTTYDVDDLIGFSGTGTDPEDGTLSGDNLSWELRLLHNEHTHFDNFSATGESGNFTATDHGDNTALELCLTVTDDGFADNTGQLSDTVCVQVNPNTSQYTFDTVPSDLALTYADNQNFTPHVVQNAVVNGTRQIAAAETQANWSFDSWSDGGAAVHDITIGNTSQTLLASYTLLDTFSDSFSNFSDISKLHLNGDAQGKNNRLRLTSDLDHQTGSGFYFAPFGITEDSSFSTRFQFHIHSDAPAAGADGMTFMIQGGERSAIGLTGGGLGYNTIGASLAIEIDSYQNALDQNDNHIGVLFNGIDNPIVYYIPPFNLESASGDPGHTMWVDYDGIANQLDVYLVEGIAAKPATPQISMSDVNLHAMVGDMAFIGFSGSTGGEVNNHDIINWDLSVSSDMGSNTPPTISNPGAQTNTEGDSVSLSISASDPDGDILSYSASGLPPGLSIESSTGEIAGTLPLGSAGSYPVIVSVSDGIASDSASFTWTVNPSSEQCGSLVQEAEDGIMFGLFEAGNDSIASNGQYLYVPPGAGNSFSGPNPAHRIEYCFQVDTAGIYRIIGGIYAETGLDNSFFIQVDGSPANGNLWDFPKNTTYLPDYVSNRDGDDPVEVTLLAGEHTITVYLREDGARLDTLALEFLEPIDPPDPTCHVGMAEAEDGDLFGDFLIGSDNNASGGEFIHVPEGAGNSFNAPNPEHRVDYCFQVDSAGLYQLTGNIYAATGMDNSFFIQVDGTPVEGYLWDFPKNTVYREDFVSDRNGADPVTFNLSAGEHTISVYLREDGARLDKLTLEDATTSTIGETLEAAQGIHGQLLIDDYAPNAGELDLSSISFSLVDSTTGGENYSESINSNAIGQYYFDQMPLEEYRLRIHLPLGFVATSPTEYYITANPNQMIEIDFHLQAMPAQQIFLPLLTR